MFGIIFGFDFINMRRVKNKILNGIEFFPDFFNFGNYKTKRHFCFS
jgi:hypothetical protein